MATSTETRTWRETVEGDGRDWRADDAEVTVRRTTTAPRPHQHCRWEVTVRQTSWDGSWYTVAGEWTVTRSDAIRTAKRWVRAMTRIRPK